MRIITWNCNMAFRKKAHLLLAYKPDILVIQECECVEKLVLGPGVKQPNDILWFGKNQHKGMAIIAYGDLKLKVIDGHDEAIKMVVPVSVTGGNADLNLFAVWANNPADPDGQYVEQVWKAIHHYDPLLSAGMNILLGDLNSNTIWDKKYRTGNHSHVVQYLAERNIHSAYHRYHQQEQGKEEHPTFYLYRHKNKPYHMDHCFASAPFIDSLSSVEVGDHEVWAKYSDHMPVMVTFEGPMF